MTDDAETASSPSHAAQTSSAAADPGSQRSNATSSTPRTAARTSDTSNSSGRTITASLMSTSMAPSQMQQGGRGVRTAPRLRRLRGASDLPQRPRPARLRRGQREAGRKPPEISRFRRNLTGRSGPHGALDLWILERRPCEDVRDDVVAGKEGGTVMVVQVLSLIHISEPTRRTPISYAVFCLK